MFVPIVLAGLLVAQAEPDVPKEKAPPGGLPKISGDWFEQKSDRAEDAPAPDPRPTAEWRKYILAWRRDVLASHAPGYQFSAEAKQPLLSIRDQSAVSAIVGLLKTERERRIRMAYMEALSKIGGKKALDTLVRLSLDARDARYGYQRLAGELIAKMPNRRDAIPLYAKSLKSEKTREATLEAIRRAELAVPSSPGELPDPTLTNALVSALIVEETRVVPYEFTFGWSLPSPRRTDRPRQAVWGADRRLVRVRVKVPNEKALETLTEYTGVDFGYDQEAWRRWYTTRKRDFSAELGSGVEM